MVAWSRSTPFRPVRERPTLLDHLMVFVVTTVLAAATTFIAGAAILGRL